MPFLHLVFPRASLRPTTWYNNFFPLFDIEEGKISAQPHTIVKQICFPYGNVLFL